MVQELNPFGNELQKLQSFHHFASQEAKIHKQK